MYVNRIRRGGPRGIGVAVGVGVENIFVLKTISNLNLIVLITTVDGFVLFPEELRLDFT